MTDSTRKVAQGRTMATVKPGLTVGIWWWIGVAVLLGVFIGLVLVAGCGLTTEKQALIEQQQRESISGQTTADVVTASKMQPADLIVESTSADGTKVTVKQPVQQAEQTESATSAKEKSDSSASGFDLYAETLPFGTKLILAAVGLGLLAIVIGAIIFFLRRSSTAVNAAWKFADDQLANQIHSIRSRVMAETNPAEALKLASIAADLERDRVNLLKD